MMKILQFAMMVVIIFGGTLPAWASVELNAYLPLSGYRVTPQFKFEKLYQLDYSHGGKIKEVLAGRNLNITCSGDSTDNQSIKQLMEEINSKISSSGSLVHVTNLSLSYSFTLTAAKYSASMDYVIIIRPTITDYLLDKGGLDTSTTLDASWISFAISDPVIVNANKCGETEINHPLSIIQSVFPDVYSVIYNTSGQDIFDQSFNQYMIDSTPLMQQPLDKWDSLFDPAYTLTDMSEPSSFVGQKVPVTTFSTGLTGLGQQQASKIDTDFTADTTYHLSAVDLSSGTINVQGHANPIRSGGGWTFVTTIQGGQGTHPVGGLPTVAIYAIGGVVTVVAIGFWLFYFRRFRR